MFVNILFSYKNVFLSILPWEIKLTLVKKQCCDMNNKSKLKYENASNTCEHIRSDVKDEKKYVEAKEYKEKFYMILSRLL